MYLAYPLYPFGLLNIVGYWTETQIFGGVVLFEHELSRSEVSFYLLTTSVYLGQLPALLCLRTRAGLREKHNRSLVHSSTFRQNVYSNSPLNNWKKSPTCTNQGSAALLDQLPFLFHFSPPNMPGFSVPTSALPPMFSETSFLGSTLDQFGPAALSA